MLPALTPALLLAAAVADLTGRRTGAHVARGIAAAAALATAWVVLDSGPLRLPLYHWLTLTEPGERAVDAGLFCDGSAAALLVLLSLWTVAAPLVTGRQDGRTGAALDLAAVGGGIVIIADGALLSLAGTELLLAATFVHGACGSATTPAARRLLAATRLGGMALVGTLVFADAGAAPWLAMLAAAILVGAWPCHSWLEDLGDSGSATGIRLVAAVVGLCLFLRFAEPLPAAVAVIFALSSMISVVSSLSTQDLFRAQVMTMAAQGSLVLAAATLVPMAALMLVAAYGAAQLAPAMALARIESALPAIPRRFTELGGLAAVLPWPRWLTLAGAIVACFSGPSLRAHAALAGHGMIEAGPPGAVLVVSLLVLPVLPLLRLALVPYSGPVRHTTTSTAADAAVSIRTTLAVLVLVALGSAAVGWSALPPPATLTVAIAAGAAAIAVLAGFLLWRNGPSGREAVPSPARSWADEGFGVSRVLTACGVALQATGRFCWTAIDSTLFGGVPGAVGLTLRATGWLLARLHDGRSGWAMAAAVGTIAILLWSTRTGGTW
ncbi:MAG TPA: hypothetical protein QGF95_16010 [Candidatus Latescibacteria bacterium]|nr:hypothetical protein [Gemmatimonadaceae bacterium]MDP6017517.1 hypothetical protein [Candidatus Latescibacterota bacterium]HJP32049.1 hypothetical protein [Candidatus Latescibacterota bacterium]